MKKTWLSAGQILLTLIVVVVAAIVLWRIVNYYMFSPWTRDGHVRADVIQVAPDVAGLITSVQVADNQEVKRGQVLFVIDQARYTLAERFAEATLAQRRATLAQAKREYARNLQLGNLVASEQVEESRTRVEQGEAAVADAQVSLDTAKLNLQRTTIVSPVDGYLNDRAPRVGEYVPAGRAVLSVVDRNSFRVDGYFEMGLMPWEAAAGMLVAAAAGARSGVLRGGPPGDGAVLAASPGIFDAISALLVEACADDVCRSAGLLRSARRTDRMSTHGRWRQPRSRGMPSGRPIR